MEQIEAGPCWLCQKNCVRFAMTRVLLVASIASSLVLSALARYGSNPGKVATTLAFQDQCFRPLSHPSDRAPSVQRAALRPIGSIRFTR